MIPDYADLAFDLVVFPTPPPLPPAPPTATQIAAGLAMMVPHVDEPCEDLEAERALHPLVVDEISEEDLEAQTPPMVEEISPAAKKRLIQPIQTLLMSRCDFLCGGLSGFISLDLSL